MSTSRQNFIIGHCFFSFFFFSLISFLCFVLLCFISFVMLNFGERFSPSSVIFHYQMEINIREQKKNCGKKPGVVWRCGENMCVWPGAQTLDVCMCCNCATITLSLWLSNQTFVCVVSHTSSLCHFNQCENFACIYAFAYVCVCVYTVNKFKVVNGCAVCTRMCRNRFDQIKTDLLFHIIFTCCFAIADRYSMINVLYMFLLCKKKETKTENFRNLHRNLWTLRFEWIDSQIQCTRAHTTTNARRRGHARKNPAIDNNHDRPYRFQWKWFWRLIYFSSSFRNRRIYEPNVNRKYRVPMDNATVWKIDKFRFRILCSVTLKYLNWFAFIEKEKQNSSTNEHCRKRCWLWQIGRGSFRTLPATLNG